MLNIDQWKKHYSVLFIKEMLNPKVFNSKDYAYPKNSLLVNFHPSVIPNVLSRNELGLNSAQKVIIYTVDKYRDLSSLLGSFDRLSSITKTNLIAKNKATSKSLSDKTARALTYLEEDATGLKISDLDIFVSDYGSLEKCYRYNQNPLNDYYRWYNNSRTVFTNLNPDNMTTGRTIFITYRLPNKLPDIKTLNKIAKKPIIDKSVLTDFPNYMYFNLLELWKMLTPEIFRPNPTAKVQPCLFKLIPSNLYGNIYLMLIIDNRILTISLRKLLGLVAEYKDVEEVNTSKYNSKLIKGLLYVCLNNIINSTSTLVTTTSEQNISKVNDDDSLIDVIKSTNINQKSETVDITKALDDMETDNSDLEDTETKAEHSDNEELIRDMLFKAEAGNIETSETPKDNITIDDFKKDNTDFSEIITAKAEILKQHRVISPGRLTKIKEEFSRQKEITSPYPGDKQKLSVLLDISQDDIDLREDDIKTINTPSSLMPEVNTNTLGVLRRKYITEQFPKDKVRMIYALQKADLIISNHTVEISEDNILGSTETHNITISGLDGKPASLKIVLPKIEPDGTHKKSGNTYVMRLQKTDLPIRKIDIKTVALSSYYGKLFVVRSRIKNNDLGYWIGRQVVAMYSEDNSPFSAVVTIPVDNNGIKLPRAYENFARGVHGFIYTINKVKTKFSFIYSERYNLTELSKDKVNEIEGDRYIVVGSNDKNIILLDFNNNLSSYDILTGKITSLDNIYSYLGIDINEGPIEYSTIKIFKQDIPTGLLLSYYIGLENLLHILNTNYTVADSKTRVKIDSNQFSIVFNDMKLIINRDYGLGDLILSGFRVYKDDIKNIDINLFNHRNNYDRIFSMLDIPVLYSNEIKIIETLFVDPVTEKILIKMDKPDNFKGLLLESNIMLLDDQYQNPNDVTGMVFRGSERIAGMMYKELVTAYKEHLNRSSFGKSKITVNPYGVMSKIEVDSTTMQVDDLNPMAAIKQLEDITALGVGGRSKDGMSIDTRKVYPSDIGIISEASIDSGDVGIKAFASSSPLITNTLGMTGKFDPSKHTAANIFSTGAFVAPCVDHDDSKRTTFSSVMLSHVIPTVGMTPLMIRAGGEHLVAIRAPDKYAITAVQDGKVTNVTDTNITVEYDDKTIKTYRLYSWTTKEESGKCYEHKVITNLRKGDKFKKDETITYDSSFFIPDFYNPRTVIYRTSRAIRVMLVENKETADDSCAIYKPLALKLASEVTVVRSIVINCTENIYNVCKMGDSVTAGQPLLTISTTELDKDNILDERALSVLQDIVQNTPKSKVNGKISKVIVYYNASIDEMSNTMKKLVRISDTYLKTETGYIGKVNSSYSISGVPLQPGQVEIKIYTSTIDTMSTSDKGFIGNQLKCTVGEVFTQPILDEYGNEIECKFSNRAIAARITNSPYEIGTTMTVLDLVKKKAIEMYFK